MREIKFRAWNSRTNKMTEPFELRDVCQECACYDSMDYDNTLFRDCEDHVMQFTGLKDKDGKDIYEGDILTGMGMLGRWIKYRVELPKFFYGICDGSSDPENCRVIGNRFENPELL